MAELTVIGKKRHHLQRYHKASFPFPGNHYITVMANQPFLRKEIIVQQLGVDAEKVTADASFVDDLGADSLDVVELVLAFEEEFGVEIPDEAAEKIATVKDANEFLKQNPAG